MKELRLALAMRGGVSLAVWIGGACVEIDALRRARRTDDTTDNATTDSHTAFWGSLLATSEYERAIVDVITGASAGGLNGVLFAAGQHYGFDVRQVRQLWLDLGGLEELVRTGDGEYPSLLDGDGAFLAPLQQNLSELIAAARPGPADTDLGPRVDLQLSATLLEPIRRTGQTADDERYLDQRYLSRFHFRHQPSAPWLRSDLPLPGDPAVESATWRLALAARSTSSFPAAFEPAVIRSTRPKRFAAPLDRDVDPDGIDQASGLVDMRGVFADAQGAPNSSRSAVDDDFVTIDGGLLDNIPIAKALEAIAEATADRPTTRVLAYLHPTGPVDTPLTDDAIRPMAYRRSLLNVALGIKGAKLQAETTLGDIALLEEQNRCVLQAQVLRESMFAAIPDWQGGAGPFVSHATGLLPQYRAQRSRADGTVVCALLSDPVTSLGGDPFPAKVGSSAQGDGDVPEDRWRSPLGRWTSAQRQAIGPDLSDVFDRSAFAGAIDPAEVFRAGTGPIERVIRRLIEWARFLDGFPGLNDGLATAGQCREQLYRTLTFVGEALVHPRDQGWVTVAATRNVDDEPDWNAERALATVDSLLEIDDPTPILTELEMGAPSGTDGQWALGEFLRTVYARLDGLRADAGAPAEDADIRLALLNGVLIRVARRLQMLAAAVGELPPDRPGTPIDPARLLHEKFSSLDLEHEGAMAMAAIEIVCFAETVGGSSGSLIQFVRISAAAPTAIAAAFEQLPQTDGRIEPGAKLAGNELMNFAAFAKSKWRANDWMWGRLDSVPTLVNLLVTANSMRRWARDLDAAGHDPLAELEQLITTSALGEEWTSHLHAAVWERGEEAIKGEVAELIAGESPAEGSGVDAIRAALAARRQWEIVAVELALPTSGTDGDREGAPLTVEAATEAAKQYSVGTETLKEPRDAPIVELFKDVSDSAGRVVVDTYRMTTGSDGEGRVARIVARVGDFVRRAGRAASDVLLGAPRDALRVGYFLWLPLLVLVVGATIWAFQQDPAVAGIAAAAGVLAVLLLVGCVAFLVTRLRGWMLWLGALAIVAAVVLVTLLFLG